MGQVSFAESVFVMAGKVIRELEKEGYNLTICGEKEMDYPAEVIYIPFLLESSQNRQPKRHFFGLIRGRVKRDLIAKLWLLDKARGANHKNWIFEIFGRQNVDRFKQLAEKLSETHDVKIHVRIESENSLPASIVGIHSPIV